MHMEETKSISVRQEEDGEGRKEDKILECSICYETARDAVVSMCGHLFCWPCLHQWMKTTPKSTPCPICKSVIRKDRVIPLYGRDYSRKRDPRKCLSAAVKVPPRPNVQRVEVNTPATVPNLGLDSTFHVSFRFSAFPFGLFTSSLNFGESRPNGPRRLYDYEEELFLSKIFPFVLLLFVLWLLFSYMF